MSRRAPGPPGLPLLGHLLDFRRDVLAALVASRQRYGDVVRFRLGPHVVHLVAHPRPIEHVLLTRHDNYDKNTRSSAKIRAVTGPGLLTSSGAAWLRQRRLTQPLFARERVAAFAPIVAEEAQAMLERWAAPVERGEPIDVASELMRLTCTVIARALFGADVSADLPLIERSATVLMEHAWLRLRRVVDLGVALPTPSNRRFTRALRELDDLVRRIGQQRRADGEDLLTLLRARRDDPTETGFSEQELRNETITLLLAGHETTANALTWTFYLLAANPSAAERAAQEARSRAAGVLEVQPPSGEGYLQRAFREALRLYPPIWIMERRAIGADVIDGFAIPAGSSVIVSPYVTHRHPEFWPEPERFDPDRFLQSDAAADAYLPFGLGQRYCIGSSVAELEAKIILQSVLERYRLSLPEGRVVRPLPGITLRVDSGLPLYARRW